jgi:hypothetical protein
MISLGAVIMQDRNSIAIYSWKLNTAQKQYTTTERVRELLLAIEKCKAARNTRISCKVTISPLVFTENKNDSFNGFKALDRVLRWILLIE